VRGEQVSGEYADRAGRHGRSLVLHAGQPATSTGTATCISRASRPTDRSGGRTCLRRDEEARRPPGGSDAASSGARRRMGGNVAPRSSSPTARRRARRNWGLVRNRLRSSKTPARIEFGVAALQRDGKSCLRRVLKGELSGPRYPLPIWPCSCSGGARAVFLAQGCNHVVAGGRDRGYGAVVREPGIGPARCTRWTASLTELGAGALLLLGWRHSRLRRRDRDDGVAWITNHLRNGSFIFRPGEGYEYVMTLTLAAIGLAGVGAGQWSVDHALGWFDPPAGPASGSRSSPVSACVRAARPAGWRPAREQPSGEAEAPVVRIIIPNGRRVLPASPDGARGRTPAEERAPEGTARPATSATRAVQPGGRTQPSAWSTATGRPRPRPARSREGERPWTYS